MPDTKKRLIKSLDNLAEELKELLRKQYPNGYEGSITRIITAKKEPIFVFPLETDDSIILVKVPATKNSDGGYDVESPPEPEFESAGEDGFNSGEDDFDSGDSNNTDDDYDDDGGGKRGGREASYDPDFDA
jgi:hypothetical protein